MTAPVPTLNLAAPAGPGAVAPAAAAGGPLAGFEALLAALFGAPQPQAGPLAAPEAQVMLPGQAELPAAAAEAEGEVPAATPSPEVPAEGAIDPSLLGLLNTADPQAAPAPAPTQSDPEAAAPPAWGRDKGKGEPAAPALAHASPNASFQEPEAAPEAPAPAQHAKAEPPAQAQAVFQRAAAPVQPEAAAPAVAAQPATPPATTDAELPAPPPAAPSAPAPPPPAALAAAAPRPNPTPAAPPQAPPVRAERGRAATPEGPPAVSARPSAAPGKAVAPEAPAAERPALESGSETAGRAPEDADAPDAAPLAGEPRAQAAGPAASPTGSAPVRGSPETVANLAAQIVKKLEGRSTRFDLELTPAGMGKVDVRLEIAAHGRVTAAMTFDNPQAAAELKARAGELQRTLEQAGFDLSGGLSFDVAGDRGQARQGWGEAGGDTGRRFPGEAFQAALDNAGEAEAAAVSGGLRLRRGVTAGVDVRI